MNRGRSLLKFSYPARALKKFSFPAGAVMDYVYGPRRRDRPTDEPSNPYRPPGSFVTLDLSDTSTHAYVLRYAHDGRKVHDITFGPRQAFRMTNSCDGLVGVYGPHCFWIANPTIPRVAALPSCSPHVCRLWPNGDINCFDVPHAAIGLADASTGEHKVVRIFVRDRATRHPISLGCEVLSLKKGSRRFWKQVEDPPAYALAMFSMPLVVDGTVYWTKSTAWGEKVRPMKIRSKFRRSVVALCFDLREEKFSLLHHPKQHPKAWSTEDICYSNLFLLEGRLCLVDSYVGMWMTVWILEDRASSEWVRRRDFRDKAIPCIRTGRKVFYELPTMDYDDVQTLKLLSNNTSELSREPHEGYILSLQDYCAPYAGSNFWPF